jgi:N-acetyl-gamma-glutamyl-phosphate reductase
MHNYSATKTYNATSNFPGKVNVAVVGGTGYSGHELVRILKNHKCIDKILVFGSKDTIAEIISMNEKYEFVFLATPAEVSINLSPELLSLGKTVIDLSGAFRLNTPNILEDYLKWYSLEHLQPSLVKAAHYGLVPWNVQIQSKLIANPGCYATAVLMALLPLLKNKIISENHLVIDAKSGTTGAGKKPSEGLMFSEVDGECLPYKISKHQHLPEITHYCNQLGSASIDPHFSTHLLPVRRGIIVGLYSYLLPDKTSVDVDHAFKEFYAHYPLVKFSQGINKELVSLKSVAGTAHTHISYVFDDKKIYLYSVIDNLLKGAASQAVENFNILLNQPIDTGLEYLESII